MTDIINKAIAWIKANTLTAILIGFAVVFVFFGRQVKRILFAPRRVRHHRYAPLRIVRRHRPLPRSVGMHRVRKQYTKGGKAKKPWQIKGSPAARRHMAQIRRMR